MSVVEAIKAKIKSEEELLSTLERIRETVDKNTKKELILTHKIMNPIKRFFNKEEKKEEVKPVEEKVFKAPEQPVEKPFKVPVKYVPKPKPDTIHNPDSNDKSKETPSFL